ncbi:MAG TPA: GyrI-like domain-containing protein [Methylomusa anaerophila]|uniref:GyrI-like small molecule binding domain-containing protein n=1 Tax=Methylomusa anaerophila TaxID=1930071 RepID=A0A348AFQ1_9FIRM|nr:GyrI-like domain-containing protein [Methylomusa anaerophila]BBB89899.1 hypothetical protein MAMMFC1_00539 [Methylomusa anaerophila]HML90559.1 GyrI-like domain-containing protein [Methylomusa anaerophila]
MKYEWKKEEKNLYFPKSIPELITVPKQKFFILKGKGNPSREAFAEEVGVLYSLAYAIRMMPKQGYCPAGYFEYTVYPLEGIWDFTEAGKRQETLNKDELLYTIMIRQPEFVTQEVAEKAIEIVKKKKPHPLLAAVSFEMLEDGLSVQMLHLGPYDTESQSFKLMNEFIANHNLEKRVFAHREIYLSDARKVQPDKLKTVLRYMVKPIL